jgi:hypothetical protein
MANKKKSPRKKVATNEINPKSDGRPDLRQSPLEAMPSTSSEARREPSVSWFRFDSKADWSVVVSVLAFLVSIGGIGWDVYMSNKSLDEAIRARFEAAEEVVAMTASRMNQEFATKLTPVSGGRGGYPRVFIDVYWRIRVANKGQRDIALVEYRLKSPDFETNWDCGLTDLKFNAIEMPINLPAGHAAEFCVRSRLFGSPTAKEVLEKRWPFFRQREDKGIETLEFVDVQSSYEVFNYLYDNGIDCFGNKVFRSPRTNFPIKVNGEDKDQRIILTIQTGRGTTITNDLLWYDSDFLYPHDSVHK